MSNLRQLTKPSQEISDFEWERTPYTVKIIIARLEHTIEQKQQDLDNVRFENHWLRGELDLRIDPDYQSYIPSVPEVILWALIGFILTVGGTFVEAYSVAAPWSWADGGITIATLGVTYQIGAVLLTGCLGGKNAAILSQIAHLSLGLLGVPLFGGGGGWQYVLEPNFGYLLGFVFGSWLCGYLAFKHLARIDSLMLSCLAGLLVIHLTGIIYLTFLSYWQGLGDGMSLLQSIDFYSFAFSSLSPITTMYWIF